MGKEREYLTELGRDGERNGLRAGIEYRLPPSYSLLLRRRRRRWREGWSERRRRSDTILGNFVCFGLWRGEERSEVEGRKARRRRRRKGAKEVPSGIRRGHPRRRKARDPEMMQRGTSSRNSEECLKLSISAPYGCKLQLLQITKCY